MNVRHIRLLIWKEVLQLRRDPLLLRALIAMPIIQLVLFGYVVAADVRNLATAVIDLDRTPISRQVTDSFEASGYFTIVARPASEAELRPLMDSGQVWVAIVVEEGTSARLDRGETAPLGVVVDGSDAQVASAASGYAAQIVARLNNGRLAASGLAASAPGVDARVRVLYNPTLAGVNTMIPGLIAAILMISMSVIMSQAVVRERESGTLEQMFVTPITPEEYLVGKVVPYAVFATAQAGVVALLGAWWFGVPFNGSPLIALTGLALFLLTCIGQGLLVSLVSHTRHQAQQTVMFIMIPTITLSGFIFPIESMPDAVQPLASFLPLTWALRVLRGVFVQGAGWEAVGVPLLVLAGFAAAIFGASVVATHRRLAE